MYHGHARDIGDKRRSGHFVDLRLFQRNLRHPTQFRQDTQHDRNPCWISRIAITFLCKSNGLLRNERDLTSSAFSYWPTSTCKRTFPFRRCWSINFEVSPNRFFAWPKRRAVRRRFSIPIRRFSLNVLSSNKVSAFILLCHSDRLRASSRHRYIRYSHCCLLFWWIPISVNRSW